MAPGSKAAGAIAFLGTVIVVVFVCLAAFQLHWIFGMVVIGIMMIATALTIDGISKTRSRRRSYEEFMEKFRDQAEKVGQEIDRMKREE